MNLSITIASDPDLEQVYAELLADGDNWADLTYQEGVFRLAMYPHPAGQPWLFDLETLLTHLQQARLLLTHEKAAPEEGAG